MCVYLSSSYSSHTFALLSLPRLVEMDGKSFVNASAFVRVLHSPSRLLANFVCRQSHDWQWRQRKTNFGEAKNIFCSTLCCCSNLIVAEFKFSRESEGGKQQQQGKSRVRSSKKNLNSTQLDQVCWRVFFLLLPLVLCVVPHCLRSYVCFASEHWGEFTAYMDVGECMSQLNAEKTRGKWIFFPVRVLHDGWKVQTNSMKNSEKLWHQSMAHTQKNCCVMKKNWTRKSIESESIKCALYI